MVTPVTDASFQTDVLASDGLVLVDFWAEWCGPCRMVAPVVEELATELAQRMKAFKLNVDENPGIAGKYGIMSIPTLALFKNGELKERLVGYRPKNQLQQEIERNL